MQTATKAWISAVAVCALIGTTILLSKPENKQTANPSPSTSSINSTAPEASERVVDPNQEALPVVPVKYGQAVQFEGLSVVASDPVVMDFTGEFKTVLSIQVSHSVRIVEFESEYGFQFIDGAGVGTTSADTVGFKTVGPGLLRKGEVQVEAVEDNFKNGTLLLISRSTGMPVGAWK